MREHQQKWRTLIIKTSKYFPSFFSPIFHSVCLFVYFIIIFFSIINNNLQNIEEERKSLFEIDKYMLSISKIKINNLHYCRSPRLCVCVCANDSNSSSLSESQIINGIFFVLFFFQLYILLLLFGSRRRKRREEKIKREKRRIIKKINKQNKYYVY